MDFASLTCPSATSSLGTADALLNTFVTSILALHCNITSPEIWPEDYGEIASQYGSEDFDFIVIGAGSAGSVVAGRLAENIDNKVLLIEAGGDPPLETEIPGLTWTFFGSEIDWNHQPVHDSRFCKGRPTEICSWNCGKVIGGSHSLNILAYFRGIASDYDRWELAGNPSWGYDSVLPFFKKTEKFKGENPYQSHGVDGPMNVEPYRTTWDYDRILKKAATELGYPIVDDFTDGPDVGWGPVFGTQDTGRRMSTAKAFLTRKAPNLYVMKHAVARKIRFTRDLKAKSVSVVYKKYYDFEMHARKEIIVSAGSLGTPKLLMLSGIGPQAHLKSLGIPVVQDLNVGGNLQDHSRVEIFLVLKNGKVKNGKPFDPHTELLEAFFEQLVHRRGLYADAGINYAGFISTDGGLYIPDVQLIGYPILNMSQYTASFKSDIGQSLLDKVTDFDVVFNINVILLRPKSRGFLKLVSKDYRDSPLFYPNFLNSKDDVRRLVRGIRELMKFLETDVFKKRNGAFLRPYLPECDIHEFRSDKYWECYVAFMTNSSYHFAGTAKMGPRQDKSAVVNSKLQVHGVKRLRVADASIMPNVVSANTNAATIMIGEKAADFIRTRWSV